MLVIELGETIRTRRGELGLSQPALAELAKVSINTLYKVEKGQANPSIAVLNKLANVLGMELKLEIKK